MRLVMKAARGGDLRGRHLTASQQADRTLNAKAHHKLMWRQTHGLAKEPREVKGTNVCVARQRQKRDVVG